MAIPEPADIEIIETRPPGWDGGVEVIVPNDIRINGHSVLAPADRPVIVHEVSASADQPVQVTLTLYARRVRFAAEETPTDG